MIDSYFSCSDLIILLTLIPLCRSYPHQPSSFFPELRSPLTSHPTVHSIMILLRPRTRPMGFRRILVRQSSTHTALINARSVPAPHSGSIRILALNNPKSRNAISRALLSELTSHINDISMEGPRGSTRALILTSDVDASFCAGADLKERRTFTLEE